MKKFLAVLAAFILLLGMASCQESDRLTSGDENNNSSESTGSEESEDILNEDILNEDNLNEDVQHEQPQQPEPQPEPEPTPDSTEESEFSLTVLFKKSYNEIYAECIDSFNNNNEYYFIINYYSKGQLVATGTNWTKRDYGRIKYVNFDHIEIHYSTSLSYDNDGYGYEATYKFSLNIDNTELFKNNDSVIVKNFKQL